jgi:hypothetical protein
MNTGFYILAALLVGFGLAQILFIRRQGDITAAGWEQIRGIIYAVIDDVLALYQAEPFGAERLTEEVVRIVKTRIDEAAVPAADKAFWTEARLRNIIAPVVRGLLERFRNAAGGETERDEPRKE